MNFGWNLCTDESPEALFMLLGNTTAWCCGDLYCSA